MININKSHNNNECNDYCIDEIIDNSILFYPWYKSLIKKLSNGIVLAQNRVIYTSQKYPNPKYVNPQLQINNYEFSDCVSCNTEIELINTKIIYLRDYEVNVLLFDNGIYKIKIYTGEARILNIVLCNFPFPFFQKLYLYIICEQDIQIYINNQDFSESYIEINIVIETNFNIEFNAKMFGSKLSIFNIKYAIQNSICNINYLIDNNDNFILNDKIISRGNDVVNVNSLCIGEKNLNFQYISNVKNEENSILAINQNVECFVNGPTIIKPFVDIQHKDSILFHSIYNGPLQSQLLFFYMLKSVSQSQIYQLIYNIFEHKYFNIK